MAKPSNPQPEFAVDMLWISLFFGLFLSLIFADYWVILLNTY